ncbi:hypothetical protein NKJ26_03240 [Mesorhizobium sp. M0152]|uniref:hypothetical protein n=1 Tax=Mesorhizobium sp. M0152 TaxID=2956898 RepID=UPI003334B1E3
MTKSEFITAYVLARAGAISGTVTGTKLVQSAAIVWQEIQYETGVEERPAPVIEIEAAPADNVFRIAHDRDGVVLDDEDGAEIGQ